MADGRAKNGGKRENAGRKPGALTRYKKEVAEKVADEGITPLEFLVSVVRDKKAKKRDRVDAAKAAAPYCHKRMPQAFEGDIRGSFVYEVVKYGDEEVPDSE